MKLRYNGRRVNIQRFNPKGKDLRKLVGYCNCGKVLRGHQAIPQPDPYTSEINNDYSLVVQCIDCERNSTNDI